MSDTVEEKIASWWSEISSLVNSGLNDDEKPLSSYVNVSPRPVDETYKVVNFEWAIVKEKPDDTECPDPGGERELFRQAQPEVLGAYRLSYTTEINHELPIGVALKDVRKFASVARCLERERILLLLKQKAKQKRVINLSSAEAVREAVKEAMQGRPCRLIASSIEAPKLESIVSNQIDVPHGIDIYGLLVPIDGNGPVVTRVGGDISPAWCRGSNSETVTLRLTSTFYLEHPEQALNCERPSIPASLNNCSPAAILGSYAAWISAKSRGHSSR